MYFNCSEKRVCLFDCNSVIALAIIKINGYKHYRSNQQSFLLLFHINMLDVFNKTKQNKYKIKVYKYKIYFCNNVSTFWKEITKFKHFSVKKTNFRWRKIKLNKKINTFGTNNLGQFR